MDKFTPEKRSEIMGKVRSSNTLPEREIRSILHRLGYRFRLHRKSLPGCPDIVLPKHKTVIFVHGCFWHRHPGCSRATMPSTRKEYWMLKFERNVQRDGNNRRDLELLGWRVVVIWECELKDSNSLSLKLLAMIPKSQNAEKPSNDFDEVAENSATYGERIQ